LPKPGRDWPRLCRSCQRRFLAPSFRFTSLRPNTCPHQYFQPSNGSRTRRTRWHGHGSYLQNAHALVRTHAPVVNTHALIDTSPPKPPESSPHRNTQIEDTCIVFRNWHISSRFVFALSFLAIIFISLGYEYLRAYQRNVDRRIALVLSCGKARDKSAVSGRTSPELSGVDVENAGLLSGCPKKLSALYVHHPDPRTTNWPEPFFSSALQYPSIPVFCARRSTVLRSLYPSF